MAGARALSLVQAIPMSSLSDMDRSTENAAGLSVGNTVEIDIHGEDYVPSAVPPAEVLAANKPKKPAKEGMLIRQKAKAAQSPAAALAPHNSADMEVSQSSHAVGSTHNHVMNTQTWVSNQ